MKILFLWPPSAEEPINSYKRLLLFASTASFVKENFPSHQIDLIDATVTKISTSDLAQRLVKADYDLINLYFEPHLIESALKTAELIRKNSTQSHVLAFGSFACMNPEFLITRPEIDSISYNGNFEQAISSCIKFLSLSEAPSDLIIKQDGSAEKYPASIPLNPGSWSRNYYDFYDIDLLDCKVAPGHKKEARVMVSRGCGFGCTFCKTRYYTPEPKVERFREQDQIIDDIVYLHQRYGFRKYNLNSCNFTLDKKWALELCVKLKKLNISWNTMSRIDLLDEDLIRAMADSGCYKIGIGVETLSALDQATINKPINENTLYELVTFMKRSGIKPKTCIMTAIPHQSKPDLLYTFTRLLEWGCDVRAKEYYPYEQLCQSDLKPDHWKRFDRSEFYHNPIADLSKDDYLQLLKKRSLPETEIKRNTSAGALIYRYNRDSLEFFLLQKEGEWYIPRGKIEPGESLIETVTREVEEETGFSIKILKKLCQGENIFWSYKEQKPQIKTVHTFLAKISGSSAKPKITEKEWTGGKWVEAERAENILTKEYQKEALSMALEILKKTSLSTHQEHKRQKTKRSDRY